MSEIDGVIQSKCQWPQGKGEPCLNPPDPESKLGFCSSHDQVIQIWNEWFIEQTQRHADVQALIYQIIAKTNDFSVIEGGEWWADIWHVASIEDEAPEAIEKRGPDFKYPPNTMIAHLVTWERGPDGWIIKGYDGRAAVSRLELTENAERDARFIVENRPLKPREGTGIEHFTAFFLSSGGRHGGTTWAASSPSVPADSLGWTYPDVFDLPPEEWGTTDLKARNTSLVKQKPTKPIIEPHPVILRSIAEIPNDPAHRALSLALSCKDDFPDTWIRNDHEGGRVFDAYETHRSLINFRPPEIFSDQWEEFREQTLKALDKRFRDMKGLLVADVIDIFFIHWWNNGRPTKARILLSQILDYRKVAHQPKNLKLHFDAVRDARSCRLINPENALDAAILEIDSAIAPQMNLFTSEALRPDPDILYLYSPGAFVTLALEEHAYLADYATKALELNPYTDHIAKRISRYLRSEWRLNPLGYTPGYSTYPRYRKLGDHLKDAGIDPKKIRPGEPGKFMTRIQEELEKLIDKFALGDWHFHPDDMPTARKKFRSLEDHLARRAHFPPPDEVGLKLKDTAKGKARWLAQQAALRKEAEIRALAKAAKAGK
jgi:hypothetical protein